MSRTIVPRGLSPEVRRGLRLLLVAKHARWTGGLHAEDGTHAVYHCEIRDTLSELGYALEIADGYEALFERPAVDFVFPLLNRGGFINSEMLLPILCERQRLPYLGASPIVRGLSDDKHLAKQAAAARGVPTLPWAVFRRGAPVEAKDCPAGERLVVKPNASSASWGVSSTAGWDETRAAILKLHGEGHDAIVEPFMPGHDIEVSVITHRGRPLLLPVQIVEQQDPAALRTYAEKRNLKDTQAYQIRPLEDGAAYAQAEAFSHTLFADYLPFDYGRFEFRVDADSGEVTFLEVNLNCNLWSRKTIAMAAAQIGWSHAELIETIVAESLVRQGVVGGIEDRAGD